MRNAPIGTTELDYAVVVTGCEIGVKSPAQAGVEALGTINVRNRDDNPLSFMSMGRGFELLIAVSPRT